MKKDIRIVFMGTPDFAVHILKTLHENGCTIAGVITAPDKPKGRGQKMATSAVKDYAISQNFTILQPTNLKDETFLADLKALNGNLQIVVAFRMLPKAVWQMPEYGTFNLHASLLPNYRGAAPINWAIINGETVTGVTTFFIDEKIDTGNILLQEEVEVDTDDTAGTLHDKLMIAGGGLVLKTVEGIANETISPKPQQEDAAHKDAYKIHKETCKIDWNQPTEKVYNFIRGMSPYPTAWTLIQQNENQYNIKVYHAVIEQNTRANVKPGTIVTDKKNILIATNDGWLNIKELQLPGKKRMPAAAVLNGFSFEANAYAL